MATLSFDEARSCVLQTVCAHAAAPRVETVWLLDAAGRVLAEPVRADRDYPPTARSVRDGFAVRSADPPRNLRVIGEARAGAGFQGQVGPGEAVEIMTGAPTPDGADAIIMVEHVVRNGDRISAEKPVRAGDFINAQGVEARAGEVVVDRGWRLDYARIAQLAAVGCVRPRVYARPRVAILSTGDEVVNIEDTPRESQVRNSNAYALAVQVARAGGAADILPVARDNYASTRELIERGLAADLLLLSGGVSAGKYDIVERVLADLGAEFYFDRVRIQPGQPLVFGRARGRFFFGLPGNPASTMVCFELFARAALDLLGGCSAAPLPLLHARLTEPFRHRPGLTRFLPAIVDDQGGITPVRWAGSSDVPSLARANAFLVTEEQRESWEAGDWIRALLK
ncbi:MAG TPA: gephyrin-like molybdotransferase Glp [Bryobacteraceae bacterium]|nr:gephyrin-like molybdotransferase Glp [Bryobacteraceae bacterium]